MQDVLGRFISFDKLIGPNLVKLVYYVFAVIIILATFGGLLAAIMSLVAGNLGGALMQMIAVPAVGAVALVTLRFLSEIFMLSFKTYERLGEIRDRLPDYSSF